MIESRESFIARRAQVPAGQVPRGERRLDGRPGVVGMAAVYAAAHRNGERGAVEVLHVELSTDDNARLQLLREGRFASEVDRTGTASVLDDDAPEGRTASIGHE